MFHMHFRDRARSLQPAFPRECVKASVLAYLLVPACHIRALHEVMQGSLICSVFRNHHPAARHGWMKERRN